MGRHSKTKTKDSSPKRSSRKSAALKEKEKALGKTSSKRDRSDSSPKPRRKSSRLAHSDESTPMASSSAADGERRGGSSSGEKHKLLSSKSSKLDKVSSQGGKVYRRKPADIDESDDGDGLVQVRTSTSKGKFSDKEISEAEGDEDGDGDDDARVESPREDDLRAMSSAKAKETLHLEQGQWSNKEDNAPSQKAAKSEDHSHKKKPLTKRKRSVDSGSDSSSGSNSESDSDTGSDLESRSGSSSDDESSSSESDSDSGRRHRRRSSKKSKRAKDRQSEGAKWKNDRKVSSSAKRQKKSDKKQGVNDGWHDKAHYTAPTGSERTITLKKQPMPLQAIIRAAMEQAEGDILFVDAFPSGADTHEYISKLLKQCALERNNTHILSRIKKDPNFSSALAPLITSRMNRIRSGIKDHVGSETIKSTYNLPKSDTVRCATRVSELQKSMDYIYPPGSSESSVDRKKPYQNELIITILRDYIFHGRSSFANRFRERFESTLDDDKENVEIPIAMLALVATAISVGLDDWVGGEYKRKTWNTESHSSTYENHVEFITSSIFEADRKKFHQLTSKLYQLASNTPAQTSGAVKLANAQSNFNIADMGDDDGA